MARMVYASRRERRMRYEKPYGRWTCADGREVLFNRFYEPIWQRRPGERAEPANPEEWVRYERQEWFYKDGNPPWRDAETLRQCDAILAEWRVAPLIDMREWRENREARP